MLSPGTSTYILFRARAYRPGSEAGKTFGSEALESRRAGVDRHHGSEKNRKLLLLQIGRLRGLLEVMQ